MFSRANANLRRQLADYVEYHRDPYNCAMHVFGIVSLFLATVLPLSLWPIAAFGVQTNAAVLAAVPVLVYWLALDVRLGLAIAAAATLLLFAAATIASHVSIAAVWTIFAALTAIGVALQVVGHQVFEGRQPALMDNPTHLLLGPIFVMAKFFIMLGFREDLAAVLKQGLQTGSHDL